MPESAEPSRSRIYVSHRATRHDPTTSRLLDDLRREFGAEAVVASLDFIGTPPNTLKQDIEDALESCHSLIVMIGKEWLIPRPAGAAIGSDDAYDHTHVELATGLLKEHLATIPVLVDEGVMPPASDLPIPLAGLAECEALVLDAADWDRSVRQLFTVLQRAAHISQVLGRARGALKAHNFDDALRLVDSARMLDPARLDTIHLGEVVRAARRSAEDEKRLADERAAREEALRRELNERLARQLEERRRLEQARPRAAEPRAATQGPPAIDENVQFTVFRRACIQPERWYPLLAFAHLSERRADASPEEPDPVAEVQAQAARVLGTKISEFRAVTQDSGYAVMRQGELRFVPQIEGVEFNPRERRFFWTEPVHREDFRMRADRSMDGKIARGTLTVYSGNLVLADVQLTIRVDRRIADAPQERSEARPYRRIFASYSHRDTAIVEEFETHAAAVGDRYLRDAVSLRAGEVWSERLMDLIDQADVFQLFWSWNALASPMVREEWQHALALNRPFFVRPVYWEDPLPEREGLPPPPLRRLHFQKVYPRRMPDGSSREEPTASIPLPAPPRPAAPPTPVPPSASAPSTDTGTGWNYRDDVEMATPSTRSRHETRPPRKSHARAVRYAALAAVCVIAVGFFAAVRPLLMGSRVPAAPVPSAAERSSPGETIVPPPAPPPADVPTATRPSATPGDRAVGRLAIESVIRGYERGWASKDIDALQAVWAMAPETRDQLGAEFRRARAIDVRVRIVSLEFVGDTRAIVVAEESRTVMPIGSDIAHRTEQRKRFQIGRRGNSWVIVAIGD